MSDSVDFEPIWERLRDKALAKKAAASPSHDGKCYAIATSTGLKCTHTATFPCDLPMYCRWHYKNRAQKAKR